VVSLTVRPARFNHKRIDAVIVHIESPGKAKKEQQNEPEERKRLENAGETGKTQRTRKGKAANNEGSAFNDSNAVKNIPKTVAAIWMQLWFVLLNAFDNDETTHHHRNCGCRHLVLIQR